MNALLTSALTLIGTWQYAGFRFEGNHYPRSNLVLRFTFYRDQTEHLIWYRQNEPGFCERRGEYFLDGDRLRQKTLWVNPANDRSCASDPEMQPGRETLTPIIMGPDEIDFVLYLDGRELYYILRPAQNVPEPIGR